MEALVLEKKEEIRIRDVAIQETLGPRDVRIALRNIGICGSDVGYYTHGAIGPHIVRSPMILGHEASGVVDAIGDEVTTLSVGDRVCMEPGVPDPDSRAARLGQYNLDPAVTFWATPPVHGILRPTVVHPESYTYKLPDGVSLAEGALVEPLAIGMHAATKAEITPGDVAVVIGAGTIGLVTIMSALAGGCARVICSDVKKAKLDLAAGLGAVRAVDVTKEDPLEVVKKETAGWGADIVFEASGSAKAAAGLFEYLRPGGRVVYIGMPEQPVTLDIVTAQTKEARIDTIYRYAHVYPRALELMGSGSVDVKPLITETYPFSRGIEAFEYARDPGPRSVKVQIEMPD